MRNTSQAERKDQLVDKQILECQGSGGSRESLDIGEGVR